MTNDTTSPDPRNRKRQTLLARSAAVLLATGALVGAGAGVASAADTPRPRQEYFTEVIKPFDSISIPSMQCTSGWLEDVDHSPGRIVPRGVEVTEPGSVGVTISKAEYGTSTVDDTWPVIGFDSAAGRATATNWNPFASAEVTIELHCTNDWDKAAKKTFLPGFTP